MSNGEDGADRQPTATPTTSRRQLGQAKYPNPRNAYPEPRTRSGMMFRVLFYADLHIHSKYSRACSKDCDLEHLAWWAQRKGIGLVGTGDFTHPAWYDHLREMLVPAEPGLFRLRPDVESAVERTLPTPLRKPVRFMPSVEISTIYKRDDRTRKVHHLIYFPDLDAVARFNTALGRIGNLGSDGRPILGLDSRDLLEITLESSPDGYLVPAHIWTPWFSALGSKSGFDAIEDCYADLSDHIFAVETGLSSDPPMNWQVSSLDKYRLVSNSDAHSPPALGREASAFDTDLDYYAVRRALATGEGYAGSLEFFPEEGKYHADGHRKCDVRLEPAQTRAHDGRCPECGKPLTVGVLHRVEALADRPAGTRPAGAAGYRNFIQLPEIMGEILQVGPKSKSVRRAIDDLVTRHGSELTILTETPPDDLARTQPLLAEAVARLRRGEVVAEAGYDGEYGVIRLFAPGELAGTPALFDLEPEPARPAKPRKAQPAKADQPAADLASITADGDHEPTLPGTEAVGLLGSLDPEQRAAASIVDGSLLVVAGPGTGKTRTLTHRIAHLISDLGVRAEQTLTIAFTRRAAEELTERLTKLVPGRHPLVTTFHGLGLRILREHPQLVGLSPAFKVADDAARIAVLEDLLGPRAAQMGFDRLDDEAKAQYQKAMRVRDLIDVGELVQLPVELLEDHPELVARYRERWHYLSVDEYQDVDETQYRLLRLLAPSDGNLCAIGDPDQSIYRFRGADVGFFLRFTADYPAAETVQLTRNYRSTRPILTAAGQAIAPSTLVPDRALSPVRRDPDVAPVCLHQAESPEAEAAFVARTIDQMLGGSSHHSLDSGRVDSRDLAIPGLSFNDIAVLYRTGAQSRALVEAFTQSGVPFQKRSHDRLTDRPAVQAIARELRYDDGPGSANLVDRIRRTAKALLDRMSAIDDPREVHTAVELLMPLAIRCEDSAEHLLLELATGVEVDSLDPRADSVSLLTLHASKGLEFPVVFVVGCEDGLLPLRFPSQELHADDEAEERRLFFVGMTRAQSHLYLSHAKHRLRHGGLREQTMSPFLSAIGSGVLERVGEPTRQRPKTKQQKLF